MDLTAIANSYGRLIISSIWHNYNCSIPYGRLTISSIWHNCYSYGRILSHPYNMTITIIAYRQITISPLRNMFKYYFIRMTARSYLCHTEKWKSSPYDIPIGSRYAVSKSYGLFNKSLLAFVGETAPIIGVYPQIYISKMGFTHTGGIHSMVNCDCVAVLGHCGGVSTGDWWVLPAKASNV